MGTRVRDDVPRAGSHGCITVSQTRRERLRRLRRRGIRLRGGALSLAAVAVCVAVAGATVAVGRVGAHVLKSGDRGPAVAKVQRKLHLHADGVFGRMTERRWTGPPAAPCGYAPGGHPAPEPRPAGHQRRPSGEEGFQGRS